MKQYILSKDSFQESDNLAILISNLTELSNYELQDTERDYIEEQFNQKINTVSINQYKRWIFIHKVNTEKDASIAKEYSRKAAFEVCSILNKNKAENIAISASSSAKNFTLVFAEGIALSNYQFIRYFKDKDKRQNSLQEIFVEKEISDNDILQTNASIAGAYKSRTLVNEPVSFMTSVQIAKEMEASAKEAGFSVEVFDKTKIESLQMGGLLAVNKGSIDPPTFTIMEWKPEDAVNEKPIVIVGKGVVYDTGGLSLKPTPNSMDMMKADMGGAAATIGALYSIALAKLPVYVIGIVPATDNRPGGNAYAPGDVIKMHNKLTVEVLNTDAEGRMILADGLSYSKRYEPELTFDIATLTGAAARAIGKEASVVMGTASKNTFDKLEKAGEDCYERVVKFPFWEEYGEYMKSDIADIKNIGGPEAGAITAGKFLEHFAEGDWIHIDIAGPMWSNGMDSYRGKGGSGVGSRLLFEFIKNRASE